jgi:exo-beta-1,3-glucanase (GH17 family)
MYRFSFLRKEARKMAMFSVAMFLFSISFTLLQTTGLSGNEYDPNKIHNICWSLGRGIDEERAEWGFDIAKEEGINRVRIYDAAPTPSRFLEIAKKRGVRVTMGAWLDKNPEENAEQLLMLTSAIKAGLVEPVAIVGSEVLHFRSMNVKTLIETIEEVKRILPEYVAVTTTELVGNLEENPELVDAQRLIVGMHHYPYMSGVDINDALQDLINHYEKVQKLSKGKKVVVYETGWPSEGRPNRLAFPSVDNQKKYRKDVLAWADKNGVEVYFFELIDELWKEKFGHLHEAHLGMRNADGSIK